MAWGSCGRQATCSDQPMDERSETQNTLGGQLHGVCCSFNPATPKISRVCSAGTRATKREVPAVQATHSLARCGNHQTEEECLSHS